MSLNPFSFSRRYSIGWLEDECAAIADKRLPPPIDVALEFSGETPVRFGRNGGFDPGICQRLTQPIRVKCALCKEFSACQPRTQIRRAAQLVRLPRCRTRHLTRQAMGSDCAAICREEGVACSTPAPSANAVNTRWNATAFTHLRHRLRASHSSVIPPTVCDRARIAVSIAKRSDPNTASHRGMVENRFVPPVDGLS